MTLHVGPSFVLLCKEEASHLALRLAKLAGGEIVGFKVADPDAEVIAVAQEPPDDQEDSFEPAQPYRGESMPNAEPIRPPPEPRLNIPTTEATDPMGPPEGCDNEFNLRPAPSPGLDRSVPNDALVDPARERVVVHGAPVPEEQASHGDAEPEAAEPVTLAVPVGKPSPDVQPRNTNDV